MSNKKLAVPATLAVALSGSYAQAAGMPMTPDDHIRKVIESCMDGIGWRSEACHLAIAWSNRDMASNYFDALLAANTEESNHGAAMVFNACSPVSTYDWENFPDEVWDSCLGTIFTARESGIVPNDVQYDIMSLGQMARAEMPTAVGLLENSLYEYAKNKGWDYNL